jgi:hypothetical protein
MMMKIKSLVNLIIHTVNTFVLVIYVPNCPMLCNNTVLKHIQSKCDTLKKNSIICSYNIFKNLYLSDNRRNIIFIILVPGRINIK